MAILHIDLLIIGVLTFERQSPIVVWTMIFVSLLHVLVAYLVRAFKPVTGTCGLIQTLH